MYNAFAFRSTNKWTQCCKMDVSQLSSSFSNTIIWHPWRASACLRPWTLSSTAPPPPHTDPDNLQPSRVGRHRNSGWKSLNCHTPTHVCFSTVSLALQSPRSINISLLLPLSQFSCGVFIGRRVRSWGWGFVSFEHSERPEKCKVKNSKRIGDDDDVGTWLRGGA